MLDWWIDGLVDGLFRLRLWSTTARMRGDCAIDYAIECVLIRRAVRSISSSSGSADHLLHAVVRCGGMVCVATAPLAVHTIALIEHVSALIPRHLLSRRRVSKTFLSSNGCDSDFWRSLCLSRYSVFDHDELFAGTAGELPCLLRHDP